MKAIFFTLIFFCFATVGFSQKETWFYIRVKDSLIEIPFKDANGKIDYVGNNKKLGLIFKNYKIKTFKKTQRKAKISYLKKTFFVIADNAALLTDLLQNASDIFVSGEIVPLEDRKIYEPNDYGLTSTLGDNLGLQVHLDYLDVLGAPEAWYYTTGSNSTAIGISDGQVDTTLTDFAGKTRLFKKSSLSQGHGLSIASLAAAKGDNGYGVPGVCYDCSIFATNYGDFSGFKEVKELSDAGARVVNCSWVSFSPKNGAQEYIDKIFDTGTIIVAAAGNRDYTVTKGKQFGYPASYNHVISVSSGMYKYPTPADNLNMLPNGYRYAENIFGYISRTLGFVDNDTLKQAVNNQISIATLNSEVDILAPSPGLFLYSNYVLKNEIHYFGFKGTSGPTPLVSGTLGLMFALYPCLKTEEVEPILKMASTNIDSIEANKQYAGQYGAGLLNIGKSVKMVYELHSPERTAYIEDQDFSRWDFPITATSKEVIIRNQKFRESATLSLCAKNKIVIKANTVLKPNTDGFIKLKIDKSLKNECDLVLRDPNI